MSHKSFIAGAAIAVAGIAFMPTLSQAQEPAQPLQVTSPAPHDQSQGAAQAQTTARGELVSIDEKGKMLTIKSEGSDLSFKFDDATKVTGAQRGVAGLATMTGSQVTVQYKKEGATNLATSIDVRAAAPAPAPAK
ncbi:MAG TPA: hypothetical protein VI485_06055 [Vicinamibacterales bacterium]|nr:hypothetical protein [Vicinamibacterales bacterium]